TKPATIAGSAVKGPKHNKTPHTSETTAAELAGGFSPRGNPVFGSIDMACIAIVCGLPVIGLGTPGGDDRPAGPKLPGGAGEKPPGDPKPPGGGPERPPQPPPWATRAG